MLAMSDPHQTIELQAINQAFAWWSRLGLLILGAAYLCYRDPDLLRFDVAILFAAPLLYFFATLLLSLSQLKEKDWISFILLPADSAMLGVIGAFGGTDLGVLFIGLVMLINSITDTRRAQTSWSILAFGGAFAAVHLYVFPQLNLAHFSTSGWIALAGFVAFSALHLIAFKRQQMQQLAEMKALESQHTQLKLKNYQILKYLPTPLREPIANQKDIEVRTARKKVTIFFSDVVGFSALAEEMEANELANLLNSYLSEMSEVADKYGATVDKFMGDGIMVFFGDPVSRGPKEDAVACLNMAVEMRKRMNLLQVRWRDQGISQNLNLRMGINSGYATVGNFGSNDRLDYTVLGTEVNLASRLEATAQPGEILISSSTFLLVQDRFACEDKGEVNIKGFSEPVRAFAVQDSLDSLKRTTSFVNQVSPGFSLYLDLNEVPHYDRGKITDLLQRTIELIKRHP